MRNEAVKVVTDRYAQNEYCNPPAHAPSVINPCMCLLITGCTLLHYLEGQVMLLARSGQWQALTKPRWFTTH